MNFYAGINFKLKKLDLRFYMGPRLSYNKYADIINNEKSFSKTITPGTYISLYKAKDKKYDFSISDEFSYNSNTTSQNNTKIHYNTNTLYLMQPCITKRYGQLFPTFNYSYAAKNASVY